MTGETVNLGLEADIATLTLNRPEKRNAISPEMIDDLNAALDEIENSRARVAIITGAGKAFCAGMDLEALRAMAGPSEEPAEKSDAPEEGVLDVAVRVLKGETEENAPAQTTLRPSESALESSRQIAQLFRRIYEFPKPLIAAVNGPAIAGGCGIATLCDFTLAAPEAEFGYTEVKIGFIPALVAVFLIRQVGEKQARDLLLTGRILEAKEAYELGLVNEIVSSDALMKRARELAAELTELSPTSMVYTKHLLCGLGRRELDRQLDLAVEENARIRSTADFKEGLSAFLEKRKPKWQGE